MAIGLRTRKNHEPQRALVSVASARLPPDRRGVAGGRSVRPSNSSALQRWRVQSDSTAFAHENGHRAINSSESLFHAPAGQTLCHRHANCAANYRRFNSVKFYSSSTPFDLSRRRSPAIQSVASNRPAVQFRSICPSRSGACRRHRVRQTDGSEQRRKGSTTRSATETFVKAIQ